ncbi:MAG: trypsin-like peptidase domain-containing protein [Planctomycetaceae bacterium]|nr:trypsin-like peptidase domain-containing protein [Planctomycetaceae bacterium]
MCLLFLAAPVDAADLGLVRIRTHLTNGDIVYFTGAHIGNDLILSCGHCCQAASGPGARSEVLILSADTWMPYRRTTASVLCLNHEADVGLLRFDKPQTLKTAYKLAPRGHKVQAGDGVFAYTWRPQNRSEHLFSLRQVVTDVNRYLGPANIETTGLPRGGDSGGPLIHDKTRWIIGVTSAADHHNRRGLYCGLSPIYDLLDHCSSGTAATPPRQASSP